MKAWLKGGFISAILFIFMIFIFPKLIFFFVGSNVRGTTAGSISQVFTPIWDFIINMDFLALPFCRGFCSGEEGMIHLLTSIPSFFLIGALVGWIVGRVKKK